MRARDYRRIARENLKGMWRRSAVIMLIALLMTGLIGTTYTYVALGEKLISARNDVNDLSEPTETVPAETADEESGDMDLGTLFNGAQNAPMVIQIINYITFLFGGFIALGHCRFLLNQFHKREASYGDLLKQKWLFSSAFLVKLIRMAFTMLFNVFMEYGIVPNIYFHYRQCMAMYILHDNPHMRPETAVRESAKLMKGHKWELFCLDMSFVPWHLLGILTLGVGNVFVAAYAAAAHTAFYRNLCPEIPETNDAEDAEDPEE